MMPSYANRYCASSVAPSPPRKRTSRSTLVVERRRDLKPLLEEDVDEEGLTGDEPPPSSACWHGRLGSMRTQRSGPAPDRSVDLGLRCSEADIGRKRTYTATPVRGGGGGGGVSIDPKFQIVRELTLVVCVINTPRTRASLPPLRRVKRY